MATLDEKVKLALGLDTKTDAIRKSFDLDTDAFRKLDDLMKVPSFELPKFDRPRLDILRGPTPKETNTFQSAGVLVKSMARTVQQWRAQLPSELQPTVVAMQGGHHVNVTLLAEESFHAIRVEGTIDGSPCVVLTHQATIQLLCIATKIEEERPRRTIGFVTDGKEDQL